MLRSSCSGSVVKRSASSRQARAFSARAATRSRPDTALPSISVTRDSCSSCGDKLGEWFKGHGLVCMALSSIRKMLHGCVKGLWVGQSMTAKPTIS